jgi:uncharacterized iron-regulated membrane protein
MEKNEMRLNMKLFRKIIFWCHLSAGVFAGIVVLIMSVTGALLMYERQITAWADTRGYQITQPANGERLPVETLIAKVRESQADVVPSSIAINANVTAPVAIGLTGGRTLFTHPYTGEVLGEGSKPVRSFFRTVTDWHRWLGAGGDNRTTGKAITGACNLAFLFLVMSGFYLWFPRSLTWGQIKKVLWFRRGLPSKARDFNWHNVMGFWSAVPLFIVVLSGVVISYTWAGNLDYRVVGENPPQQQRPPAPPATQNQQAGGNLARSAEIPLNGLNQMWNRAEQQVSDWQIITLRLPTGSDAPYQFTIDQGNGSQPQKRGTLTLDAKTGEITKWEPFAASSTGRKLRTILRFAHTGEVLGIFGQTIAGIVSAVGAVLVYTGLALSFRRFRAWLARRKNQAALAPSVDDEPADTSLNPVKVQAES